MGDLSDFQRRQIVGARLAGASVTKTPTSLGVYRAVVSKVMTAYTNKGKTSSAKSSSGQKPKLSERHHRTSKRNVSKNHRNTAAKVAPELSIHLEHTVSIQTVRREHHESNIRGRDAIAKPLTTVNNSKRRKRWYDDHITRTLMMGNR
jgi:transposase